MAKERLSDKLAVILHADVAGSTQLVQQDEHLAHERIQDSFRRFSDTIEKYRGTILELRGDALLAEFERASDAVSATLSFQSDQAYYLSRLKDDLKPSIRVGIAMGEVVMGDNTVTGAGVVLAQRVEQLAEPGSLCITAALHEALPNRMPFDLENIGEQTLKGFDDPVRVYRVELSPGESIPPPQRVSRSKSPQKSWQLKATIAVVVVAIAVGIAYLFKSTTPIEEAASIERMAFPLPDKPSSAVLPFNNMSDDAQQEYFADGMTEDLITDISKISGLFVIARNSVFTYKGKAVKVRQVAEELGVRYVMEGSVRRVGNQVRINAQLIDATTGGHIWAERYDGTLDDVFSMQDKITESIVAALAVTLIDQGETPVETSSTAAYDTYLQGWEHYQRSTPDDFAKAISYFEQALVLDPDYDRASTALAAVYWNGTWRRWINIPGVTFSSISEQARQYLQDAMRSPTALTYQVASEMAANSQRTAKQALTQAKLAISLDINDPAGHLAMANALMKDKRPGEAIESMQQAMRLDPHYPAFFLTRLGRAQFDLGKYEEAVDTLERAIERNPQDDRAYMYLVAGYGYLGREQDAKPVISKSNKLRISAGWGGLTQEEIPYFKWVGDPKKLREGLKRAGVESGNEWYALQTRTGDTFEIEGATKIGVETAKQLFDQGVSFVDASFSYFNARIPRAHGLNWWRGMHGQRQREFNVARLLEIVEKTQPIVIYTSGNTAPAASATAYTVANGFTKVYYFEGGLSKWKAAGYPVEKSK